MTEPVPPPAPAEPVPQAMPQPERAASTVVAAPSTEPSKKGPVLLRLFIVLAVAIAGAGVYFLFTQTQKPGEQTSVTPPSVVTQERKPDQGFGTQPVTTTPSATPTITSSDSVADIQKDLSGTALEGENTSEFDADLQSL